MVVISPQMRSVSVDLNADASLVIDIPDALCEKDKVKFTVHTKVNHINTPATKLPTFLRWCFVENQLYWNEWIV